MKTLPGLRSSGLDLDTSPEAFGYLRESSDVAHDFDELQRRIDTDGYLYLKRYLDRDSVLKARRDVLTSLREEGTLEPDSELMDGVMKPGIKMYFRPDIAKGTESLKEVIYGDRMMALYDGLFGEPATHYDYTWMRAIAPGCGTHPHMDVVYMGRGTKRLYTAWVPLGDVSLQMGGLIVLENSHKIQALLDGYAKMDVDTVCENDPGNSQLNHAGYPGFGALSFDPVELRYRLGGRWLTSERFEAGDLLTFSVHLVHASLDNETEDRIRISSDSRYQPASEPADERWVGEDPPAHGESIRKDMIC